MQFDFRPEHLEYIRDHPHELGYLVKLDKLTELHSKWIKDVWIKKLPLQAHRGSYKTTGVTEVGSLWWLLFHPEARIGIFRKPYTEAAKTVRTIVKFFDVEAIQALFYYAHGIYPKFDQKREGIVTFNFKRKNTNEGNLNAFSIDAVRTGTHLDEAMCDDFTTLDDRLSKAKRDRTKQGLMELQTNIMDPDQKAGYAGTPWHKDDAWSIVPGEVQKYDVNATGFLTPEQIAYKKSITTPSLYACNYELKHIASKDAVFQDPIYGKWDRSIAKVYGHLDAKYKGDHTNGLTFMAMRNDGFIQAVGFSSPDHIDDWQPDVKRHYQRYHAKRLYNEENADKGYLAKELKGRSMNVESYNEKMNKHVKIVSYLKKYWSKIIWAEETDPEYLVQITDYMEGQVPNDCPDSAASLLRLAFYKGTDDMALWKR